MKEIEKAWGELQGDGWWVW